MAVGGGRVPVSQTDAGVAAGGGRIARLPDALVDQIAAGEVVERPASVVKELVENAVDAGARRIRVEVRGGGARLIAVGDDGCGMTPGDARLALERHATSKLRSMEGLAGIRSFGFRGEALPAIASVSRLRLRTRVRGGAEGFELRVEAGRVQSAQAAGGPEGTRIEVADLFFAVPARRKFLKTESTEWGHVSDWLARAALALPALHFDVHRENRPALRWPACGESLDRIAAVLGEREAAALLHTERTAGGMRLSAFVSRPDAHRATASGIHLFVNSRPVRDRLLRHALLQVMRDLLPRGRFPTALLFLEVPEGAVDVNVHPAKWEVRFADPQAVHRLVTATLRDAMGGRGWLGKGATASAGQGAAGSVAPGQGAGAGGAVAGAGLRGGVAGQGAGGWTGAVRDAPDSPGGPGDWTFAGVDGGEAAFVRAFTATQGHAEGAIATAEPAIGESATARPLRFGTLHLLGQFLATYLLAEDARGLLLIDQHAAHERVLYEQLRSHWLAGKTPRQALLVPLVVELAPAALEALIAARETALRLGFEVETFGASAVALRAVPELLAERDPEGLLRELAEEIRAAGDAGAALQAGSRIAAGADHLFATLACHAARRAGEKLAPEEQRALLCALDEIPWAPTCPHGRPVAVPISRSEIERRFAR